MFVKISNRLADAKLDQIFILFEIYSDFKFSDVPFYISIHPYTYT